MIRKFLTGVSPHVAALRLADLFRGAVTLGAEGDDVVPDDVPIYATLKGGGSVVILGGRITVDADEHGLHIVCQRFGFTNQKFGEILLDPEPRLLEFHNQDGGRPIRYKTPRRELMFPAASP